MTAAIRWRVRLPLSGAANARLAQRALDGAAQREKALLDFYRCLAREAHRLSPVVEDARPPFYLTAEFFDLGLIRSLASLLEVARSSPPLRSSAIPSACDLARSRPFITCVRWVFRVSRGPRTGALPSPVSLPPSPSGNARSPFRPPPWACGARQGAHELRKPGRLFPGISDIIDGRAPSNRPQLRAKELQPLHGQSG